MHSTVVVVSLYLKNSLQFDIIDSFTEMLLDNIPHACNIDSSRRGHSPCEVGKTD
jgi:hypothetical protein